jgi:hypothetical protein
MSAYPPENPFPITELFMWNKQGMNLRIWVVSTKPLVVLMSARWTLKFHHCSVWCSCLGEVTGIRKTKHSPDTTVPAVLSYPSKVNQRDIQPYRGVSLPISYEGCQNQVFNQSYCYAPLHISPTIHDTVGFLSLFICLWGDGEWRKKTITSRLTDEGGVEVIFKLFFDRTFAEIFNSVNWRAHRGGTLHQSWAHFCVYSRQDSADF